jgi:hypothetical protein
LYLPEKNGSVGTGIVRIFNPSGLGNNEFLMWGHNNEPITSVNTLDVPTGVEGRLSRVWRVNEVNATGGGVSVGDTDIQFDLSGLTAPITASDLRLLIDHDGDGIFNEAGTIAIGGAITLACDNYLFQAVPNGDLTNGDQFTIGSINITQTPLPITLESFTGKLLDADAHLRWTTVSELNNDFFTIERSLNGKDFIAVGELDGGGTTQVRQSYEYIDPFIPYGKIYYRLRQTDFDKTSSYSNVIVLENKPSGLKLIALPNPLSQNQPLTLRVTRSEPVDLENTKVTVADLTGKRIEVNPAYDESGQIQLTFNKPLTSGIYIISLRSTQLPSPLYTRVLVVH